MIHKRSSTPEQEFFLVLVRLRLGLLEEDQGLRNWGALGGKGPPPLFECEVNVPFLHEIELIEARLPFFRNCRAKF